MRLSPIVIAIFLAFAAMPGATPAADAGSGQPYSKVSYPDFRDGYIRSLLEAEQAEVRDMSTGSPRINLRNVVITQFSHSPISLERAKTSGKPDVEMTITSDRGFMTRTAPDTGSQPEDVANLEGNVVVVRYRDPGVVPPPPPPGRRRRLDPAIETMVKCQHARWDNKLGILKGDGEVEFIQEDSRIFGTGFLYTADEMMDEEGKSRKEIKDWGGIIYIEHNARMEIDRDEFGGGNASGQTAASATPEALAANAGASNSSNPTVITCKDTASYKLREKEIQFERDVRIQRPGLSIESDIVKVFLRREDDPVPANAAQDGSSPGLGMVRSIVATTGKRQESVVITGYEETPAGRELLYVARGGRADFDYDANTIVLTDSRPERVPGVDFGSDHIEDSRLTFIFSSSGGIGEAQPAGTTGPEAEGAAPKAGATLDVLVTEGGKGMVLMQPRPGDPGENMIATKVAYKGGMRYARNENRIRFEKDVALNRGDLAIRAGVLEVRIAPGRGTGMALVERIIADTDVHIQADNREAKSNRAEYLIDAKNNLDTLRLFGPVGGAPPNPWIKDDEGNQIAAPNIVMQRLQANQARSRPRHLILASGGTVTCDFVSNPKSLTEKPKVISVKCEKEMQYNEAKRMAWFDQEVQAESDDPQDNYVLTSDRLDIYLIEVPRADGSGELEIRPRRIDANGNARLIQDNRTCEARQIIRDFPTANIEEGDIYLEGEPPSAGKPGRMAVYSEKDGEAVGAMFAAPRIKAAASGNLIQANGPGRLSVPDGLLRAEIDFAGAARYESFHNGLASEAKFRKQVVMRQQSRNLVLTSEELDATFLQGGGAGVADPDTPTATAVLGKIGRLRRVEARTKVKIEHDISRQGRRVATGDKGEIDFTDTGNVIVLSVDRSQDKSRWVMARDHDGLTLWSPRIEVRESQGITRAMGPGDLQVPGSRSGEGLNKIPTRVAYGEKGVLVYNETALNIKASDNVRIIQPGANNNWKSPSLDGRCDRLEIMLEEPPTTKDMSSDDALSKIKRMDADGGVILRVFADPPPNQPELDWMNRPGVTFFSKGDHARYDIADGRITMSGSPGRQPQLLLNTVDVGRAPHRQRLKADRFILNTNVIPRRYYFEGELESNTLRPGEAFEFQN